ncbi:sel1 repeat family protein [Martelella sp. HB161492]|uniref:sel1 repeat family protein n=1 Tax=Martelella sp. HB161492 TaxID=2720726 RepID=UPI001FEE826E|nr:sel1 repeat family protein [Martelella sp. HB161492]
MHMAEEAPLARINTAACLRLGLRAAAGHDGPADFVEAHKWLNIAAIAGDERAERYRAELALHMSKDQLAQALRAARQWMTLH